MEWIRGGDHEVSSVKGDGGPKPGAKPPLAPPMLGVNGEFSGVLVLLDSFGELGIEPPAFLFK